MVCRKSPGHTVTTLLEELSNKAARSLNYVGDASGETLFDLQQPLCLKH
jgi:hypothetical protein